jgi:hypothetical protein
MAKPTKSPGSDRRKRLSAALRDNLKRRKAQAQGRAVVRTAETAEEAPDRPHDSARIGAEKRDA